MVAARLQGFGLGLMVWLGWLIPFHRLPLPAHYAETSLAVAIGLCVFGAPASALRSARWPLIAAAAAVALLICLITGLGHRFASAAGLVMTMTALMALIAATVASSPRTLARIATVLRDLAAGCVLAVAMLAIFLPLARLRMPILTALVMLAIAVIAHRFARHARR